MSSPAFPRPRISICSKWASWLVVQKTFSLYPLHLHLFESPDPFFWIFISPVQSLFNKDLFLSFFSFYPISYFVDWKRISAIHWVKERFGRLVARPPREQRVLAAAWVVAHAQNSSDTSPSRFGAVASLARFALLIGSIHPPPSSMKGSVSQVKRFGFSVDSRSPACHP